MGTKEEGEGADQEYLRMYRARIAANLVIVAARNVGCEPMDEQRTGQKKENAY